ncbi:MAG: glycyl-radical enzyme activating protein [Terriglobia bacterium]|jgi:pyruvate formate lyase activating enzyme
MAFNPVESLSVGHTPASPETICGSIFDVQRFSIHDGPGIRTTVFFKGCLLHCPWCSNPESLNSSANLLYSRASCLKCGRCVQVCPEGALTLAEDGVVVDRDKCSVCDECSQVCPSGALRVVGQRVTVAEVLREVARDAVFYQHSGGGMTLSGGEPLFQPDFALGLLEGARALGIHTAVETNGSTSEDIIRGVLSRADLILYDMKHTDPARHRAATGESNSAILRNARLAASLGIMMVIRVPVVPGFNDDLDQISAIGEFARGLNLSELHLLPYHKYGVAKYVALGRPYTLLDAQTPPASQMDLFRQKLVALGLKVRIGG